MIQSIFTNPWWAIVLTLVSVWGATLVADAISGPRNPRKKWGILMVVSTSTFVSTAFSTINLSGGAYYSSFDGTILWVCLLLFISGLIQSLIMKRK